MKHFHRFLCLIIVFCACSPKVVSTTPVNGTILRVMSYNAHHCNPPKKVGAIDVDAVAAAIIKEKPDLVALQEIDVNTTRSGKFNQAEELGKKTGMHFYFAKAINYDGGEYGIAMLSRYPIAEMKVYKLPNDGAQKSEPRVLTTAKVALPDGSFIRFGSTHLDAQRLPDNRLMQINEIKRIATLEKLPFIIGGDFNDTPNSEVINILDSQFKRTCLADCGFTIPEVNPTKTIDFIGYAPANGFSVMEHRVVREQFASDHLPVISVLKINKN